jgi:hypothetical protein
MTLLLTPDYFAKNTCLFKDNFLHEIPIDIQKVIMERVEKDEEKELERKEKIEIEIARDIEIDTTDEVLNIVARSISNILWELKWRIGDDDDYDKFLDILHPLIDEQCEIEGWADPRLEEIEKLVNHEGVMCLLKELTEEYGLDITEHSSPELYQKCYYRYLYKRITKYYDVDDIKIIQKYNLEVLIDYD